MKQFSPSINNNFQTNFSGKNVQNFWSWKIMAKHHPDLIFCRKQAGVAIGRLCEKCDGRCVICDSYVRPCTLVRICDECNYGSYQGRCVICGGPGVSDAYYCKECTIQEKDRDGCPKVSIPEKFSKNFRRKIQIDFLGEKLPNNFFKLFSKKF